METLMLLFAVLASLSVGVLVAYAICQSMFRLFRVHATAAARSRTTGTPPKLHIQQS